MTKRQKLAKERTRIRRMLEAATAKRYEIEGSLEVDGVTDIRAAAFNRRADRYVAFEQRCMIALGTDPSLFDAEPLEIAS